jgi:hypothetical protein
VARWFQTDYGFVINLRSQRRPRPRRSPACRLQPAPRDLQARPRQRPDISTATAGSEWPSGTSAVHRQPNRHFYQYRARSKRAPHPATGSPAANPDGTRHRYRAAS